MTLYSENIVMEKPKIEIEYCTKCKTFMAFAKLQILNAQNIFVFMFVIS